MLVYQRVVLCVTASRPRAWCYPRVSSLSCSLGGAADPVEPSLLVQSGRAKHKTNRGVPRPKCWLRNWEVQLSQLISKTKNTFSILTP